MAKDDAVKKEIARLRKQYENLPDDRMAIAEGLIVEAARLRVRLDYLWDDLQEHGETEMFSQSPNTDPYERERPSSRNYTSTNKNYQAIIRQLDGMLESEPTKAGNNPMAEFLTS